MQAWSAVEYEMVTVVETEVEMVAAAAAHDRVPEAWACWSQGMMVEWAMMKKPQLSR